MVPFYRRKETPTIAPTQHAQTVSPETYEFTSRQGNDIVTTLRPIQIDYRTARDSSKITEAYSYLVKSADEHNWRDTYGILSIPAQAEAIHSALRENSPSAKRLLEIYKQSNLLSTTLVVYALGVRIGETEFNGAVVFDNPNHSFDTSGKIENQKSLESAIRSAITDSKRLKPVFERNDGVVRVIEGTPAPGFKDDGTFERNVYHIGIIGGNELAQSYAELVNSLRTTEGKSPTGLTVPLEVLSSFAARKQGESHQVHLFPTIATIGNGGISTINVNNSAYGLGYRIGHEPITVLPYRGPNFADAVKSAVEYLAKFHSNLTSNEKSNFLGRLNISGQQNSSEGIDLGEQMGNLVDSLLQTMDGVARIKKLDLGMFIPTEFRLISEYDKTVMDSVLTFLAYPLVVEKMSDADDADDADATEGSTRLAKISPSKQLLTVVKYVAMLH